MKKRNPYIVLSFLTLILVFGFAACNQKEGKYPGLETGFYLNHNDTVDYVGMHVCAGCHPLIYKSYIRTGMGLSFDSATKQKSASAIHPDSIIYNKVLDLYLQPFWENDKMKVKEFRLNGRDTIYERIEIVDYIVGSGQHTNSHMYVVNDYVFQIPFTYYTQDGLFDSPPGFEGKHNTRFDRKIGLECMTCHNGFPDMVLGSENKYNSIPLGIDCERCHGPGEAHVKYKKSGFNIDTSKYIDYSIVNPAKLSPDLQIDICARCHLQGTMVLKENKNFYDFKPGMQLSEVMDIFMPLYEGGEEDFIMASHYERFIQSQCYNKSNKEFGCVSCHDPHISKTETPYSKYNQVCASCHDDELKSCLLDQDTRMKEEKGCVACHMRESGTRDIPHVRVHDHKIRIPQTKEEMQSERVFKGLIAVNNSKSDSLTIARGYIKEFETYQPNPDYLDSALHYLQPSKAQTDGFYFNALINLYFLKSDFNSITRMVEDIGIQRVLNEFLLQKDFSNDDGWTAYRIAQTFENKGNFMLAEYFYKKSNELAEFNHEFKMNYAALLTKRGKLSEAKVLFEFILSENPKQASAHINLGYLYASEKNYHKAKEHYLLGLALDPDNITGLINLAALYYHLKEIEPAVKLLSRVLNLDQNNQQAIQLLRRIN